MHFLSNNFANRFSPISVIVNKRTSVKKSLVRVLYLIKIISQSECGLLILRSFFVYFFSFSIRCRFSHHWLFAILFGFFRFCTRLYKYLQLEFEHRAFQHAVFSHYLFCLWFERCRQKDKCGVTFFNVHWDWVCVCITERVTFSFKSISVHGNIIPIQFHFEFKGKT